MIEPSSTKPAAASARGWGVALAAALFACVLCAVAFGPAQGGSWVAPGATALVAGAYAVFFALFVRRVPCSGGPAIVASAVTILATAGLTVIQPSNALLQFWVFPLLWTLLPGVRSALTASAILAVVVFAAFGLSPGRGPGWAVTGALTEGISFAVSAVMGLWITSVYRYAAERERLVRSLTDAQTELAALHRDAGTTAERERMARELHDTLAQSLTGVVLLAQRARRDLAAERLTDAALAALEESAHTALSETRALVAASAGVELSGGGLRAALETLAERFRRESGIEVEVEIALSGALDREAEVALLRCAQEGIGNVRKHAEARNVLIALRGDEKEAVLLVRDDGRGFDVGRDTAGYGLPGLRARLALTGGALEVASEPGRTELRARVPREAAR